MKKFPPMVVVEAPSEPKISHGFGSTKRMPLKFNKPFCSFWLFQY